MCPDGEESRNGDRPGGDSASSTSSSSATSLSYRYCSPEIALGAQMRDMIEKFGLSPHEYFTASEALDAFRRHKESEGGLWALQWRNNLATNFRACKGKQVGSILEIMEANVQFIDLIDDEKIAKEDSKFILSVALELGFLVFKRWTLSGHPLQIFKEIKHKSQECSRVAVSYYSCADLILEHIKLRQLVRRILDYIHVAYVGLTYQQYIDNSIDHMEVDFGRAMGNSKATLSIEYRALFESEWRLADRFRLGYICKEDVFTLHRRMELIHKIKSWHLDEELTNHIHNIWKDDAISLRELCLFAEDEEEYVDNTDEITKRLVETVDYSKIESRDVAFSSSDFGSYFESCVRHMEIDYNLGLILMSIRPRSNHHLDPDLTDMARPQQFQRFVNTFRTAWLVKDAKQTGLLRDPDSVNHILDTCLQPPSGSVTKMERLFLESFKRIGKNDSKISCGQDKDLRLNLRSFVLRLLDAAELHRRTQNLI